MKNIKVNKNILDRQNSQSLINKELFRKENIFVINLMSSPGSGKTTFLETILPALLKKYRVGVIEGDMQGDADLKRISKFKIQSYQINTQSMCHLDSFMISKALKTFQLKKLDLLIIENIGNLICPADFDLGEDEKFTMISVSEGDDKVMKYPIMFRNADVVLLNKIDLLKYSNFNKNKFYPDIKKINAKSAVFEISSLKKIGIEEVVEYIGKRMEGKK